jgi:hypothetical protein
LVPPPDGAFDGEDVDGEPPAGGEGSGVLVAGGAGVVGGEAAGGRSPGRSPIRSLRDSEQPAIRVAPVMSAVAAMSNFFIGFTLLRAWLQPLVGGCKPSATETPP